MSPYLASRYQTAYNANHHHQQQLQKRMWAAAQYRPFTSVNTVQPLSNQYSKPNLSLNLASIQPLQVASSPRYNNNVFQQQRRLMSAAAAMSMNHHHSNSRSRTVMNRQEHHFPLIYEDTRTPLQLLCNEQTWRCSGLYMVKLVLRIRHLVEKKKQSSVLSSPEFEMVSFSGDENRMNKVFHREMIESTCSRKKKHCFFLCKWESQGKQKQMLDVSFF